MLSHGVGQWIGTRPEQQDSVYVGTVHEGVLAVVADGVGGHEGGALASSEAVETFASAFEDAITDCEPQAALDRALYEANAGIRQIKESDVRLRKMGTTLLACYLLEDCVYWISVGDSVLSRVRDGKLRVVNEDHSVGGLLRRQFEMGLISEQELEAEQNGHLIRSWVSGHEIPLIDRNRVSLETRPGDFYLLASDGLNVLARDHLEDVVRETNDPDRIVRRLIDDVRKLNRPKQDNVSVIALRVSERTRLLDGEFSLGSWLTTHRSLTAIGAAAFGVILFLLIWAALRAPGTDPSQGHAPAAGAADSSLENAGAPPIQVEEIAPTSVDSSAAGDGEPTAGNHESAGN